MAALTVVDIAEQAGVGVRYVEDLAERGILSHAGGFVASDARRVGVVQALERAGLSLDSIGEAIRRSEMSLDFVDQPDYERYAGLTADTFEMVEGARQADLPPAHVGLHAGPVLFREGDYFGRTVNLAARIADHARQGEVVVSQEVVDAGGADGVAFTLIGPVELKGVSAALTLHVACQAAVTPA